MDQLPVKQFFDWCDERRLKLEEVEAITVATNIEQLGTTASKPTVKQHLAAIRQLFEYLTTGGIFENNPAASVRGLKYAVRRGKPPYCRPTKRVNCSTQLKAIL